MILLLLASYSRLLGFLLVAGLILGAWALGSFGDGYEYRRGNLSNNRGGRGSDGDHLSGVRLWKLLRSAGLLA